MSTASTAAHLGTDLAKALFSRGFLPRELPPPFHSQGLHQVLAPALRQRAPASRGMPFNLARQGWLRRRLTVPNPLAYARLAQKLEEESQLLTEVIRSPLSTSLPTFQDQSTHRALQPSQTGDALVERRAATRSKSRYLIQADIATFYGSIYTHALEWALIGKEEAKHRLKNGGRALNSGLDTKYTLGHALDALVRNGQDGQSLGLPIGPDASLLLAEMVLCPIDQALQQAHPRVRGFRYVDDFELGFSTRSEAEACLSDLQGLLQQRAELELNPRKTRVVELPLPLEARWVTELKGILRKEDRGLGGAERDQRRALLRLLDRAIALRSEYPQEHVLSYTAGILRNVDLHRKNWPLLRDWMLQAILAEPGVLARFLEELLAYRAAGYPLQTDDLRQVLSDLVVSHAPVGHSSEVAWALWGCIELNLTLDNTVAQVLYGMEDPIVALIGLHLHQEKLLPGTLPDPWQPTPGAAELNGESWMLAYEVHHQREPSRSLEGEGRDPGWDVLRQAGVRFYDKNRRLKRRALSSAGLGYP